MGGCFTFQWRRVCFSDGGASFLSGGCTPWGALDLMGGFQKKCRMGGAMLPMPPIPPTTMGNPAYNMKLAVF